MARVVAVVRVLLVVSSLAAAAGCVLAWERIEVRLPGATQARVLDAFHGSGLAACIGAALALLMLADGLLRPRPSQLRDAAVAFAGALLVVGAALFTATGGYAPASGDGFAVTLQPGLFVAGCSGALLVLSALLGAGWRREGSRSPASSGGLAPR